MVLDGPVVVFFVAIASYCLVLRHGISSSSISFWDRETGGFLFFGAQGREEPEPVQKTTYIEEGKVIGAQALGLQSIRH
jgi:hypothetical protein